MPRRFEVVHLLTWKLVRKTLADRREVMFQIRNVEKDVWEVLDSDESTAFQGPLRACEDWLDRQQNLDETGESFLRRLFGWVTRRVDGPKNVDNAASDIAAPMTPKYSSKRSKRRSSRRSS